MNKKYFFATLFFCIVALYISCSDDNNDDGDYEPISPVTVDLTQIPYPKLSDYKFFEGDLKDQKPSLDVLPFQPRSTLFTDYAHKKRFVWMPKGTKATYVSDEKILDLPVGAALIKSFYYDNIQPENVTKILETRIMIRKSDGWIFANYIWNDEQTEAFLNMNGAYVPISWKNENNVIKSTEYRIPSEAQCIICHKFKKYENNEEITVNIPIAIKPNSLNFDLNYGNETKNQLAKWIEKGYLENNFTLPSSANSTVDYNDTSKPIDMRIRSYFDMNCAHCHEETRHCDYRPMRFDFGNTGIANGVGLENMGVCVNTQDMQDFPSALSTLVKPGNIERSMLYYRISTNDETYRMPLHGRTMVHDEALLLVEEWINSLQNCP